MKTCILSPLFGPVSATKAASSLDEGEAHLWLLPLDLPEDRRDWMEEVMSATEVARADRFVYPHLRHRFVAAHGQLRRILAPYAGVAPEALAFGSGEKGKPYLTTPAPAFNLSHSADWGLLGIARAPTIGVDIERISPSRDLDGIARSVFAPDEQNLLGTLPEPEKTNAFFACWSRKEAVIKADGRGLGMGLDTFVVTMRDTDPPAVRFQPGAVAEGFELDLHDVRAVEGYRAAVAAPPSIRTLKFFRLPDEGTTD